MNTSKARIAEEGTALDALTLCYLDVTCDAHQLLYFMDQVKLAITRSVEHVETLLTKMVHALLAFQH